MCGVLADLFERGLDLVRLLVGHVHAGSGHAPVAMPAGPALLVEVQVGAFAGVADIAGPDLDAGARVAGKDGDCGFLAGFFREVFDDVRVVEHVAVVREVAQGGAMGVGRADGDRRFDEMGVDEEEPEIRLGKGLLDTDALEGGVWDGSIGVRDGVAPQASGTVAALGDPDAPRVPAEVAHVGGDAGADLRADALVGAQKGQVAVGGGASDEVDQADLFEVPEGPR